MACAALAAHNLGFDKVQAVLTADPALTSHNIEIECLGPLDAEDDAKPFSIKTVRYNPAKVGLRKRRLAAAEKGANALPHPLTNGPPPPLLRLQPGAVTGNATYGSFLSSMLRAAQGGPAGLQFC